MVCCDIEEICKIFWSSFVGSFDEITEELDNKKIANIMIVNSFFIFLPP